MTPPTRPKVFSSEELDRALEVAQNWGGWSYEEAELIARALLFVFEHVGIMALSDGLYLKGLQRDPAS